MHPPQTTEAPNSGDENRGRRDGIRLFETQVYVGRNA